MQRYLSPGGQRAAYTSDDDPRQGSSVTDEACNGGPNARAAGAASQEYPPSRRPLFAASALRPLACDQASVPDALLAQLLQHPLQDTHHQQKRPTRGCCALPPRRGRAPRVRPSNVAQLHAAKEWPKIQRERRRPAANRVGLRVLKKGAERARPRRRRSSMAPPADAAEIKALYPRLDETTSLEDAQQRRRADAALIKPNRRATSARNVIGLHSPSKLKKTEPARARRGKSFSVDSIKNVAEVRATSPSRGGSPSGARRAGVACAPRATRRRAAARGGLPRRLVLGRGRVMRHALGVRRAARRRGAARARDRAPDRARRRAVRGARIDASAATTRSSRTRHRCFVGGALPRTARTTVWANPLSREVADRVRGRQRRSAESARRSSSASRPRAAADDPSAGRHELRKKAFAVHQPDAARARALRPTTRSARSPYYRKRHRQVAELQDAGRRGDDPRERRGGVQARSQHAVVDAPGCARSKDLGLCAPARLIGQARDEPVAGDAAPAAARRSPRAASGTSLCYTRECDPTSRACSSGECGCRCRAAGDARVVPLVSEATAGGLRRRNP